MWLNSDMGILNSSGAKQKLVGASIKHASTHIPLVSFVGGNLHKMSAHMRFMYRFTNLLYPC